MGALGGLREAWLLRVQAASAPGLLARAGMAQEQSDTPPRIKVITQKQAYLFT